MKQIHTFAALFALLLLTFAAAAGAATRISSASGNWSAATTWGGSAPPTAVDDVIIQGNFTVTMDAANASCLSLQLGGSTLGTGAGTLSFNAGTHLTVSAPVVLGVTNNTPGSVNMAAGGTLTCQGLIDTRVGTWTPGTGTLELSATNALPKNAAINYNNLLFSGGTTSFQRNTSVAGTFTIAPGAAVDGGANVLTISGDWTNNGVFTGNTGTVTFARNGDQHVTGNGQNHFNLVRANLGTTITPVLLIDVAQLDAPSGFLNLVNGTVHFAGAASFANTVLPGPSPNIPVGTGLWIDDPNMTVIAQGGSFSLRGSLRVSAGTVQIGNAADSSLVYQNGGSQLTIDGGRIDIAGRLSGNNATATLAYTQSGGVLEVNELGSTDAVFSAFDLGVAGSTFTVSGGTIVVRDRCSAPADFKLGPLTANVTGGTLQIGDAQTANSQTIRIQSARTLGALVVSNATAQAVKPTAQITGSSLTLAGGVTVQPGTTLDANGFAVTLGGDWSDQGTVVNTAAVTFNGTGTQNVTRIGGETFGVLGVSKSSGTLTLGSAVTVTGSAILAQGAIAVGTNVFTLAGPVSGACTITSAPSGTVNYSQSAAGQSVLAGSYGNLSFSDFAKVLPASGTIGVASVFTPGAGAGHTVTGSTFDFDGAAAQSVPAFPYVNLTLSGGGAKSASGTRIVTGGFTLAPGTGFTGTSALELDGATHSVAGTLATGTLTLGAGATLTNNGAATVTSIAGTGTFIQAAGATLALHDVAVGASLQPSGAGNQVTYTGTSPIVAAADYQTLAFNGSGAATLTGVPAVHGALQLAGTIAVSAAGPLAIDGPVTAGGGTSLLLGAFAHTLKGDLLGPGSIVATNADLSFAGSSLQSFVGGGVHALTLVNAAGLTLLGDAAVSSALTLTSGTLHFGGRALTVSGTFTNTAGALDGAGTATLVIDGAAVAPVLPALSLATLTLDRAAGASLAGDLNVATALTIANGKLTTGANQAVLGANATLSEGTGRLVVGKVTTTRTVSVTTGTVTFGGIGADITLHGTALGATSIARVNGSANPGGGHASILRRFDIAPAVNTALDADLTFHYDSTETNGQNAAAFELYRSRDGGATWNDLGGIAAPAARTVALAHVNDFARMTVADTSNRLGNSPLPVLTSIAPSAKNLGDPGFTLTVTGSDFVSGKSVVNFNGAARPTTFLSPQTMTAAIPASDLLTVGGSPVTVTTADGGGVSAPRTFTVNALPAATVAVETAANGTGTVVSARSLSSGTALTVFAISRDALHNFVANVSSTWSLGSVTGGVVAGDLVAAADGKSATFTAHAAGSAAIQAASGVLTPTPSGTITVTAGAAARVRVETAANGTGVVVPSQSLASGSTLTMFAIARDASGNFVGNIAATSWILNSVIGGVVAGDLVPAADQKSATFTAHVAGSAGVQATSGLLPTTSSGTLFVTAGAAAQVRVETAANGTGAVVSAQSLASGSALTAFAVTRDASGNFVANVAASTWTLESLTGGVVAGDLIAAADLKSATFTAHSAGSGVIRAASGALASTPTGAITVTAGTATQVRIETAANGTGAPVSAQSLASGNALTVFAIARDVANNFVGNVGASSWTLGSITGGVAAGDLVAAADAKSAVFTAHAVGSGRIQMSSGALTAPASGVLTVTPGAASQVRVETAANGTGTIVPSQNVTAGTGVALFAISRDACDNFIANVAATSWSAVGPTGGIIGSDLVVAADKKSATFTGHVAGTTAIRAAVTGLTPVPSGVLTVVAGAASQVRVETAADGSGGVLPATPLASNAALTVYAITRDAFGNFVANVSGAVWSLQNVTGGVVAGNLVAAPGGASATLTCHNPGTAVIRAVSGVFAPALSGVVTCTGIAGLEAGTVGFALQQNFPNPFQHATVIRYSVAKSAPVRLHVYDIAGREVARLVDEVKGPGEYSVRWETPALRSGSYFYRLESGGKVLVRKMLLMQ